MTGSVAERLNAALADRYRIERELGAGGMATVYLARDLKHDRMVAVKVLKPELAAVLGADRFIVEIKTTAALQHPHVLPLFDSGTAGGFLYYVMPFIDGETLRDKLHRETQLGVDEAVKIAIEVADALHYAHTHGVIHRDIKPENILMANGRPMVADFGIALAVSAAAGGRMTETGLSLGTPHYMSPEQATAEKEITGRSDVYSRASVLYEMLTGEPPHMGNSAQQIIMKIITDRARPVTELRKSVPPNVAAAVAKALEKLPADRFSTAKAFAEALSNATYALPGSTIVAEAASRSRWKERAAVPLAATAALLLVAALWGWLRSRPEVSALVTRVQLVLPDSAPLSQQAGNLFAITEDGSKIVYVGPGSGDIDLWIRPIDALAATRIPETTGGDSPFLSPDGESVAFYRNSPSQLFTASLRGGPRQVVASDSMLALAGDWGPDGSIYFSRSGGLRRVAKAGGAVEEVTRLDSARGDVSHGWVDVLPNGKAAVFTIRRAQRDANDIAVVDLRSHEVRILFRGMVARYAVSGHLVYSAADGGLFAIGFDANALTTHGTVIPIVADVGRGGAASAGEPHFAVSRTGTLLYGTGGTSPGSEQLLWVDRSGRREVIDSTFDGMLGTLALSPDGRRVAISVHNATEWQIWTKDLNGGPTGKVSLEGASSSAPSWSADGNFVMFRSDGGGAANGLYRRRADGSLGVEPVFLRKAITFGFQSADGAWAILQEGNFPTAHLYARRTQDDTAKVPLVAPSKSEFSPRLSPDGHWLAYVAVESERPEVYVSPFPNTSTSRTQVSVSGGLEPLWARSGRELFYTTATDASDLIAAQIETAPTFRVVKRTTLFSRAAYNASFVGASYYDVSPDGRRFIMSREPTQAASEHLVLVLNWFAELRAAAKP